MRLALLATLMCTTLPLAARAADAGVWQWQQPIATPSGMTMHADDPRRHVGDRVHAPDGSVIGSLDSAAISDEAGPHASVFFVGGVKYLIPGRDLAVMNGRFYAHDVGVAKVPAPQHPAAGL